MEHLQKLPRYINSSAVYQLTIRGWKSEWTISYEFGTQVLGDVIAHGDTIDEAAKEMIFIFNHSDTFKYFDHLQNLQ